MFLSFLAVLAVITQAIGQVPIPKRPVGFVYNHGQADANVQLDAYMGPLCPDSQNAFPTLKQVATYYGPDALRLRIHLFPLPYHRNAFLVAMGQHIVDKLTHQNKTYDWMEEIYKNLDVLSNDATADMSENEVKRKLAQMGTTLGVSESAFLLLLNNEEIDENTRIGWKYTCTRGVAATPTFMLNDVFVAAEPTWTVDDWKKMIDPLMGDNNSRDNWDNNSISNKIQTHNEQKSKTTCKVGKKCEYLPGKVECCKAGEHCIPNVGCRC